MLVCDCNKVHSFIPSFIRENFQKPNLFTNSFFWINAYSSQRGKYHTVWWIHWFACYLAWQCQLMQRWDELNLRLGKTVRFGYLPPMFSSGQMKWWEVLAKAMCSALCIKDVEMFAWARTRHLLAVVSILLSVVAGGCGRLICCNFTSFF